MIFFDESFNFVSEGSTAVRVTDVGDGNHVLVLPSVKSPKNGYVYVYLSNESNEAVYYDNFVVGDNRGRIIEEDHYYSFGLKIAGISSKKLGDPNEGGLQNPYQYQGSYSLFDDETGWNDFRLRNYDPQIGRWIQQDPFDEFPSGYTGMGNNPVSNVDPTGGCVWCETASKTLTLSEITITAVRKTVASTGPSFLSALSSAALAGLRTLSVGATDRRFTSPKSEPNNWLNYPTSNEKMRNQWDRDQNNFRRGNYSDLTQSQIEMYNRWDQNTLDWKTMSLGAVGILGAPVLGATAPGLFAISSELAGTKALISFGTQTLFNGVKNVDYADVASDAFTAPGLSALINGGVDFRPFAQQQRFRLTGINKNFTDFSIDAGTTFFGGVTGNATWAPLKPLLRNSAEKAFFYFSTQSWLNAGSQGLNNTLNAK